MQQIVKRLSSSTPFKRVFGRSYSAAGAVAAAGSDVQPTERRRKRVTKDQRKAMLESYVNEYRAISSGKFPTASDAQKQVGGSYYFIRKLVQELEYQSRMSTTSIRDENIEPKDITEGDNLSDDSEVSSTNMTLYKNIPQNAQTRDGTLLVKEAAWNPKSLPDVEQVSGSEITIDADTCEETQKDKKMLLRENLHREKESTVMEKVSQDQMTLDAEIHRDEGVQRDAQTSLETEATNKVKLSSEIEELLFSQKEINVAIRENAESPIINDVDSDTLIANDQLTSTSSEKTSLDEMARPSAAQSDRSEATTVKDRQLKEEAVSLHPSSHKAEDNVKEETVSGDMREVDGLKSVAEQLHQAKKSETLVRDLSKEQQDDTQPQRKSFMWENLKSLANGIVNIWRKL